MTKKKQPADINVNAFQVLQTATGEYPSGPQPSKNGAKKKKNPAAVALGRLGGAKGGPARAKKLSKQKRSEIAQLAANKRWHNS